MSQRLSAVDDSLPHAHAIQPPADAITRNTAFLASLPLHSLALHEAHGNVAPLPPAATAAYDVILSAALCAALADPNDDAPVTLFYALPRLLLAPFPPNSARGGAAETVRRRAVALGGGAGGGSGELACVAFSKAVLPKVGMLSRMLTSEGPVDLATFAELKGATCSAGQRTPPLSDQEAVFGVVVFSH